ncbi:unnamed protein product [Lathyrus oleraceus]
MSRENSL